MAQGADSTAVRTALWRALHVLLDEPPHVVDDLVGVQIADVDDAWRTRPDMNSERTRTNRASIVARSRAAEDTLGDSGSRQYVLLGAGLDTFAQRQDGNVRVFEIDEPATQEWKRQRLDELGYLDSARPILVPVDFEAGQSWLAEAKAAGLDPTAPTVVAMLGVLIFDTLPGLFIGIGLSALALLYRSSRPNVTALARQPGAEGAWVDGRRKHTLPSDPAILVLRVEGGLYFANADFVRAHVRAALTGNTKAVVLDGETTPFLDVTAASMLMLLAGDLQRVGVALVFAHHVGQVRDVFTTTEAATIAEFHPTVDDAVEIVRSRLDEKVKGTDREEEGPPAASDR